MLLFILSSMPASRRSAGEGNGNPLQYLVWRIPWTEEPGGLKSMGLPRVGHNWVRTHVCIYNYTYFERLVLFSRSVTSDWPHGQQHARLSCPSPTPGGHSNSCALSRWCHPTISSSAIPFSSHLQSFPASGSFLMSQLFALGGQRRGTLPKQKSWYYSGPYEGLDMCLGKSSVNLQNQWKRRRTFRKPEDMFTNRNFYLGEKVHFSIVNYLHLPWSAEKKGALNSVLASRYTKTNRE